MRPPIFELYLILQGVLSPADPGVLEAVAQRRIANEWGLTGDWQGYDVLVGVADCRLLNRRGWLIANGNVYSAIAVDCENGDHAGMMAERGLMADANIESLGHLKGWLVLK